MAELSRPWNGRTIGDAGTYTAEQWREIFKYATVFAGDDANVGILRGSQPGSSLDALEVRESSPVANTVFVNDGAAMVKGIFYFNSTDLTVTVAANTSGNPRIDTMVLRVDYAAQTVRAVLKQGTPAASPARPALTQVAGVTWEIPLADIAVANAFVTIVNANITNYPAVANAYDALFHERILNNSGGELKTGDVVIWDTTADRAVTTSTSEGNSGRVAGVWVGLNANGTRGRVLYQGIGWVNTGVQAVSRFNVLGLSWVAAKQALPNQYLGAFATALAANTGAGLTLAYIDAMTDYVKPSNVAMLSKTATQALSAGVEATVTWDSESYKNNVGAHSNVTNNERFTCARGGFYLVIVQLDMGAVSGTYRQIRIKNTAGTVLGNERQTIAGAATTVMGLAAVCKMTAGEYIYVTAESGSVISTGSTTSKFNVMWLGEAF